MREGDARGEGRVHLPPLRRVDVEGEDAARREDLLAVAIEGRGEERLRRVEVGRVDQDEIAVLERDLLRLMQAGHRLVEGAKRFGEE